MSFTLNLRLCFFNFPNYTLYLFNLPSQLCNFLVLHIPFSTHPHYHLFLLLALDHDFLEVLVGEHIPEFFVCLRCNLLVVAPLMEKAQDEGCQTH